MVCSGKIDCPLELQRNRKCWNARGIDDFYYYVQLIFFPFVHEFLILLQNSRNYKTE